MNRESANSRTDEFMRNISYGHSIEDVRTLMQSPVDIYVPEALANSYECQCLILTTINELVRLSDYCPTIRIHMPATTSNAGLPLLTQTSLAAAITSWIKDLPYDPEPMFVDYHAEHACIRIRVSDRFVNLSCNGWSVHLSESTEPV